MQTLDLAVDPFIQYIFFRCAIVFKLTYRVMVGCPFFLCHYKKSLEPVQMHFLSTGRSWVYQVTPAWVLKKVTRLRTILWSAAGWRCRFPFAPSQVALEARTATPRIVLPLASVIVVSCLELANMAHDFMGLFACSDTEPLCMSMDLLSSSSSARASLVVDLVCCWCNTNSLSPRCTMGGKNNEAETSLLWVSKGDSQAADQVV